MKLMLDTDTCIFIIRRNPPEIVERFKQYVVGDIGISSITAAELYLGAAKSRHPDKNLNALEEFFLPLEIAPFDQRAAFVYGPLRAHLEKAGTPAGSLDTLIGAHALSLGTTLVTGNVREFSRIPDLSLTNWLV